MPLLVGDSQCVFDLHSAIGPLQGINYVSLLPPAQKTSWLILGTAKKSLIESLSTLLVHVEKALLARDR